MACHLHTHSSFSSRDGLIRPEDLVDKCLELGFSAACITDHGNLRMAPHLWRATEGKIKRILGMEAYLAPNSRHERKTDKPVKNIRGFHIVLLAKNEQGWKNLSKLATLSELEGYYYNPRIDWELLDSELGDHLICLSACMKGQIPQSLIREEGEDIEEVFGRAMLLADKYRKRFKDNFFLEIQAHEVPGQKELNEWIVELAKVKDIPLVATTDAHFLERESYRAHQALVCLARGTNLRALKESGEQLYGPWFYLQTPEEMQQYLPESVAYEAITNTDLIANMIEEYSIGLNSKKLHLVKYKE